MSPRFQRSRSGFTLLETLAVMAVIILLMALVIPNVVGQRRGQALGEQVELLSSLLQQARVHAVSQNTFVWLGFHEKMEEGVPVLVVSTVAGKTGQATDLAGNNLRQINKPLHLRNALLDATYYTSLPGIDTVNNLDVKQSPFTFAHPIGRQAGVTFSWAIVFNPSGGARINASTVTRKIGIGIAAGPEANATDVAAVQISGMNGNVTIFRK